MQEHLARHVEYASRQPELGLIGLPKASNTEKMEGAKPVKAGSGLYWPPDFDMVRTNAGSKGVQNAGNEVF